MPTTGRREVTYAEARSWSEDFDSGKSIADIAEDAGRDRRTVRNAIRKYTEDLERRETRRVSLQAALGSHFELLLRSLTLAGQKAGSIDPPSLDRLSLTDNRPTLLLPYDFRLTWTGEDRPRMAYAGEESTTWNMLRSHLEKSPVWKRYDEWSAAVEALVPRMLDLFESIKSSLKEATGAKLAAGDGDGVTLIGVSRVLSAAVEQASGTAGRVTGLLRGLTADERGIWGRGSWKLVQGANGGDEAVERIRNQLGDPDFKKELDELSSAVTRCRETGSAFAEEVDYVASVPHLGGECRGCAQAKL